MKKLIIAFVCIGLVGVFAQNPLQKITQKLQVILQSDGANQNHLVWVFFTDKGNGVDSYFSNPLTVVTQKSLDRRSKIFDQSNLISVTDLPVNQNYINQIIQYGFIVKHKSKWFNAVSGYANENLINLIAQSPFVKQLDVVGTYGVRKNDIEFEYNEPNTDNPLQPEGLHTLNYGNSFTQLNQINVPAVHDSGFNGTGVTICVMDAGFSNLTHEAFSSMNIAATYDFSTGSPNLTGHGHGTATLSLIGGFKQGQLIGPAFGATYLLARTEVDPTETPQEEDNWIAAMEWADSLGVDVTSTSLGYLDFDPPFASYSWEDMDGNTARITIAADYAASLGITVVNSAGNNGFNSTHNTLGAPADGDSVITIGAVTSSGTRASFSSVGPTFDGRIKPDLMAMGSNNYYAGTSGNQYWNGSGTSFSCPLVAGVCALLLQKNPSLTPMEILQLLRSTASQNSNPNNLFGWGIINALSAISLVTVPVELTSFSGYFDEGSIILNWITSSETNNYGFEVERRHDASSFETIAFINGNGTTTNRISYTFKDKDLFANRYFYRLKQMDFDGSFDYSNEIAIDVPLSEDFELFQNYPNPFNPTTKIRFFLPQAGVVKISLFDILGSEIKILYNSEINTGTHELSLDGSDLATGIYFVKMFAGDNQQTIKISLIK